MLLKRGMLALFGVQRVRLVDGRLSVTLGDERVSIGPGMSLDLAYPLRADGSPGPLDAGGYVRVFDGVDGYPTLSISLYADTRSALLLEGES